MSVMNRSGAADDDVVDDHAHEVVADGVVLIHGLRDGNLRAHSVGRRGEQRTFEVLEHGDVEESGESAHPTHDRGVVGGRDGGLHQFDGTVSGLDIDAGCGVGGWWTSGSLRNSTQHPLSAGVLLTGIGYSPEKQAVHSWLRSCSVAAIMPSREI